MNGNQLPKASGIYAITHLPDGKVYIGSSIDMRRRLNGHFSKLRQGQHHSVHLQRAYDLSGVDAFSVNVVEFCGQADLMAREQYHMDAARAYDRATGYNLCPSANWATHSEETCAKMRGRKVSPEGRAKMSAASKGRIPTAETRAKIAASHKGQKRSVETCAKIAAANRLKRHTPEAKAKISASKQNLSSETRRKMSEHRLGKPSQWREKIAVAMRRPETREKLRLAQTGKKASQEAREKMRQRMLARAPYRHTPESKAKIAASKRGKRPAQSILNAAARANRGRTWSPGIIAKRHAWRADPEAMAAYKAKCSAIAIEREQRKRDLRAMR